MDGNGRWATQRHLPRSAGHQAGVQTVRKIVEFCSNRGIEVLTLFAFSSENWRRPAQEVTLLMRLFLEALERETRRLHEKNVRLCIIGDRQALAPALQQRMFSAEALTAENTGLRLVVATNYGGRWDIIQGAKQLALQVGQGTIAAQDITEALFEEYLSLNGFPSPDLLIRTGGEHRISNFLLWHLAYTELYFTDTLWPDFDESCMEEALRDFSSRQRRFGRTGAQVDQCATRLSGK
ncbi:polyprenyl diphosphate synthase [Candidatus Methylospira mobilis]|nr:polyprenyl diphosphate synthase [Candidatus Methylospira mobilis]WNV06831.1 polyprenyl diphosphate synthase [Candidatus Methylospira mobilis]